MIWQLIPSSLHHRVQLNLLRVGVSRRTLTPSLTAFQTYIHHGTSLPIPPLLNNLESPQETAEARAWITRFKSHNIPKGVVEMSFSRSSGPGGQNVNKVNTKATLRCPIDSEWIPIWARPELRNSPYYAASTRSLLITSTVFRSQSQNVDDCLSKLHTLIISASLASIKNEPTEEQKKRVIALERAEKANRRKEKAHRSDIKKGRASGKRAGGAWD